MIKKTSNTKYGFAILYATLVGGVVLAIGAAILSVTIKQISLAIAGRESQKAFYAADTGIECALYFDRLDREGFVGLNPIRADAPTHTSCESDIGLGIYSSLNQADDTQIPECYPSAISCAGLPIVYDPVPPPGVDAVGLPKITNTFHIGAPGSPGTCANVTVIKYSSNASLSTRIESRGLSNCNGGTNTFERAIKLEY